MNFDISQHLDAAAAEVYRRIHGEGYADLHQSVKCKYRDIVTNTLSGVLLGRTDYADMEAIAADVIRGWGGVSPGMVPVPVTVEKEGKSVREAARKVAEKILSEIKVQPKAVVSTDAPKKAPVRGKK